MIVRQKSANVILIPAYDEEENVIPVLSGLRNFIEDKGLPIDVVICNDGSTDQTRVLVEASGLADLVLSFEHAGYWETLRAAVHFADKANYDSAVIMDADGQHDPENIMSLISSVPLSPDIVVVSRSGSYGNDSRSFIKAAGIWFYTLLLKLLIHVEISDPTSGNIYFSRRAIKMLSAAEDTNIFRDICLLVWAVDHGLTIAEVPGRMQPSSRRSKIYPTLFASIGIFCKVLLCVSGQRLHPFHIWNKGLAKH